MRTASTMSGVNTMNVGSPGLESPCKQVRTRLSRRPECFAAVWVSYVQPSQVCVGIEWFKTTTCKPSG